MNRDVIPIGDSCRGRGMKIVRHFPIPVCSGACDQGRLQCPVPAACQISGVEMEHIREDDGMRRRLQVFAKRIATTLLSRDHE